MDTFAQIADNQIVGRQKLLYNPEPEKIDKRVCELKECGGEGFKTTPKISTKEELYTELEKMKEYYKPFMEIYAPEVKSINKRQYIESFVVDGEKEVKIPEYGGPVGYSKKVYESEFVIDAFDESKAYFICFKGADYKADVFVNDEYTGSHEGFFAPFEFEISKCVKAGRNKLRVVLYNDHTYRGNAVWKGGNVQGDKLYAATGIGWNEPEAGWHHCPPGMGIYNRVYVEERNTVHITDVFVRPLINEEKAEIWVEVNNCSYATKDISLEYSVFGQNFKETVVLNQEYIPYATEFFPVSISSENNKNKSRKLPEKLKNGVNIFKFRVDIKNPRLWEPCTPYLYQVQVSVLEDGVVYDTKSKQFGMREFRQDYESTPKGMFYLNNKKIRLRGANTMGYEQQDVLNNDTEQLLCDMLLAKLCNMNFLRLTQRPVQDEIYELCDKIGIMTQTDLPLFGVMRRTKFAEGIRQAEEMERLVRSHPCNIMVSYINEPFPNAGAEPHRHLIREELEEFFKCCDSIIKLTNPDRVTKHVDGDYDPPTDFMPDYHCYNMWYNGHGLDIGRLHKGYWISVKPDWYYGCGEYGTEGLDFPEIMKKYYPKEWLAEPFSPGNIYGCQSHGYHMHFYDTQDSMEDWVCESQKYQAFATRVMTESFRRNKMMVSNAIHLFIDAWPAGWMKTIMDCERNPKQAYFAYKNALEPVLLSLRCDRFTYFEGEKVSVEAYICNDTSTESDSLKIRFELYDGDNLIKCGIADAAMTECDVSYAVNAEFVIPKVNNRSRYTLKGILLDKDCNEITYNSVDVEIFADVEVTENPDVEIITALEPGEYEIAGEKVTVKSGGRSLNFVSRKTGHKAVREFLPHDFSYWYDKKEDMITPLCSNCFTADGFTPILIRNNPAVNGDNSKSYAAAEKLYNGRRYVICLVDLRCENPVAKRFLANLCKLSE